MNDNKSVILLPKRLMALSLQNVDGWRTYNEYVCMLKKRIKCHLRICGVDKNEVDENTIILATTLESAFQSSILEALFIRELKPSMNTKDELRHYELVLTMC